MLPYIRYYNRRLFSTVLFSVVTLFSESSSTQQILLNHHVSFWNTHITTCIFTTTHRKSRAKTVVSLAQSMLSCTHSSVTEHDVPARTTRCWTSYTFLERRNDIYYCLLQLLFHYIAYPLKKNFRALKSGSRPTTTAVCDGDRTRHLPLPASAAHFGGQEIASLILWQSN